jgi:glutathione S-transferase
MQLHQYPRSSDRKEKKMSQAPLLVSHHLCPYVQRAAIVAAEKGVALNRKAIDLAAKPDWFLALSPTGKTPLLLVTDQDGGEHPLFESAAIAEYLDETGEGPTLMPRDPIARARTRAWVEFASAILADIAGYYSAAEHAAFDAKRQAITKRFLHIEREIVGPWFAGDQFGLVDAAFGPVFRYLDAFETLADVYLVEGQPKLAEWRKNLAERPTVVNAVAADYPERLRTFLLARGSQLSRLIA